DQPESVGLPPGVTVTLDGATWSRAIEFVPLYDADPAAKARIQRGVLAADATFWGIRCRGGADVTFWGSSGLQSCTLADDVAAHSRIADGQRGARPVWLICAADRRLEFQPGAENELRSCTLAAPAELERVPCAAGSEVEIVNDHLIGCVLAIAANFNGLDLPAGSELQLTDTPPRVERFVLPTMRSQLRAFGMDLPSSAEVWLCPDDWAVSQVMVPNSYFLEIAGVKLTGAINFDCGRFRDGELFEGTPINGETWTKGRNRVLGGSRSAPWRTALISLRTQRPALGQSLRNFAR